MEMHQIRYFLAVASERNFTKAAAKCAVSAPSLLRAIALLEHEFGGKLVNRERANTHLSELGRIALPHLQALMDEAVAAKQKAGEYLSLSNAKLKVGIMCTIAPAELAALVGSLKRQYPDIVLRILDANAHRLQADLISGELEIAIYCIPGGAAHERTHVLPLFREQMVIALNPKNRLAKNKVIRAVDLQGEPYLDRINCEFTGFADNLFASMNISGPTVYESERDDWVLAMAASGMGYAFLPRSIARYPGVVTRPMVEPELWRTVNLVTIRGRTHSPAVGAFVREVMRAKWLGQKAIAMQDLEKSRGRISKS